MNAQWQMGRDAGFFWRVFLFKEPCLGMWRMMSSPKVAAFNAEKPLDGRGRFN